MIVAGCSKNMHEPPIDHGNFIEFPVDNKIKVFWDKLSKERKQVFASQIIQECFLCILDGGMS